MPRRESTIEREEWLTEQLDDTPLASAKDLEKFGPYSESQIRKLLTDMKSGGLVRSARRGATVHKQDRYVLTGAGVNRFRKLFQKEPSWYNCEQGVRDLAARLPMVEQFYKVVPKLVGPPRHLVTDGLPPGHTPRLLSFRWLRSSSLHAIAQYEGGLWFILVWVGLWSTVRVLREKWNRVAKELVPRPAVRLGPSYDEWDVEPSAYVIVAHDLWAAQLGIEEVAPDVLDSRKLAFVDGRDFSRPYGLPFSGDQVMEDVPSRETGEPERAVERLERSAAMNAANGTGKHNVFNVVSEYNGCTAAQIRRYLRDALDEDVGAVLQEQMRAGLVARFGRNYYLAPGGSTRAAGIDRRRPDDLKESLKNYVKEEDGTRARYRAHDERVMEIAIRLKARGLHCANGWRGNLHVDGMRTVTPDLMVLVGDGPFGHDWCYLEYEHSATTEAAIQNKLRTYKNFADHGVDLSLIVVCDTEKAEKWFLDKGESLNINLVTALYSEVRKGPVTGDVTVFRNRQGPVSLYPATGPYSLLMWPEIERRNPFVGRWAPDRN